MNETDLRHLRRCVELAEQALNSGDEPFGSILVSKDGAVLFEERNHVGDGDATQHPEFAIARWAAENLTPEARRTATVYTSGEHCPMCAAAHAWVGLGRIVYASSTTQLASWIREAGRRPGNVKPLPIGDVVEGVSVEGPVEELAKQVKQLHLRAWSDGGSR